MVDVVGVGPTQARNLAEARSMAADLVVALLEVDQADVQIDLHIDLPGSDLAQMQRRRAELESELAELGDRQRRALLTAKALGVTGRDLAVVLGVSEQRVSQLLAKAKAS